MNVWETTSNANELNALQGLDMFGLWGERLILFEVGGVVLRNVVNEFRYCNATYLSIITCTISEMTFILA